MICHKKKIIFIHIPKCGGSSIKNFYFEGNNLDWKTPNYDKLFGWCPKRRIHMQHATPRQLLELDLIDINNWKNYLKFTFVRNPFDRAYSDYLWIKNDSSISGSFKDFIKKKGPFKNLLNNKSVKEYRGDHLIKQSCFFDIDDIDDIDEFNFIGRFENYKLDMINLNKLINIDKEFNIHEKKNKNRLNHYSLFYSNSEKDLIENHYREDIAKFKYNFEDKRIGWRILKKLI